MEIKNFIKIYDDVMPLEIISNLIKFANLSKFQESKIGGAHESKIDFNIRRTYNLPLSNFDDSLTKVHWANLLYSYFNKYLEQFKFDNNTVF